MKTEQIKEINTRLALIEAEMGRIRVMVREASEQTDSSSSELPNNYSHLLPEGYEFCEEGEHENWVKVECPSKMNPLGHIWKSDTEPLMEHYRPIRKTQYHDDAHEAVTIADEHECKYCGAMTSQPDEQCYKNTYAVDWLNAPDWADVHCWDKSGIGYWYGRELGTLRWNGNHQYSTFTLPDGLDWKLSKTYRPQ